MSAKGTCPHCWAYVVFKKNGQCPECGMFIDEKILSFKKIKIIGCPISRYISN